jgi:hypothetical protein
MLIRGLAADKGQKMARERDGYQKLPKVTNLGVAPYIAPAIKASVIAGYTTGKSLRKLAIEFRLGRPTVTKIVNKLRQERLVELSRGRFKEFIDAALESYKFALRKELNGKRAAEFLKAHGIIPDLWLPRMRTWTQIECPARKKPLNLRPWYHSLNSLIHLPLTSSNPNTH